MVVALYTMEELADELRYTGADRVRSVRRLFQRYSIPILRRDRGTFLATDAMVAALLEAMKCSPSENGDRSGISVERSVSVVRSAGSKNTLRDAIAEKMRKHTGPVSKAS